MVLFVCFVVEMYAIRIQKDCYTISRTCIRCVYEMQAFYATKYMASPHRRVPDGAPVRVVTTRFFIFVHYPLRFIESIQFSALHLSLVTFALGSSPRAPKTKKHHQSLHSETNVIIMSQDCIILTLFLTATLCRERYLTRDEIKTQYQKAEKRKRQSHKHNFSFSVLTSKKKLISETLVKYTME